MRCTWPKRALFGVAFLLMAGSLVASSDDFWKTDKPPVPPAAPAAPKKASASSVQMTAKQPDIDPSGSCIVDGLTKANLTIFLSAIQQAGVEFLGNSAITVFAPTNEAFEALGSSLESLNASYLGGILESHVVTGVHTIKTLAAGVPNGLRTTLADTPGVDYCDGDVKTKLDVAAAGSSFVLQGGASSVVESLSSQTSLCDGNVSVLPVRQLLVPCCFTTQALLQGSKGLNSPLFVTNNTKSSTGSNSAMASGFEESILAYAMNAQAPAKVVLVPTAAAWQSYKSSTSSHNEMSTSNTQQMMKDLAAYHISYDAASPAVLAASGPSGTVVQSALGVAQSQQKAASCEQNLHFSVSQDSSNPTLTVTSDDEKSSATITGIYQTCAGTYVYQIDSVLEPCQGGSGTIAVSTSTTTTPSARSNRTAATNSSSAAAIGTSPLLTGTSLNASLNTATPAPAPSGSSVPMTLLIGVVVGAVVLLAALAGFGYMMYRRRTPKHERMKDEVPSIADDHVSSKPDDHSGSKMLPKMASGALAKAASEGLAALFASSASGRVYRLQESDDAGLQQAPSLTLRQDSPAAQHTEHAALPPLPPTSSTNVSSETEAFTIPPPPLHSTPSGNPFAQHSGPLHKVPSSSMLHRVPSSPSLAGAPAFAPGTSPSTTATALHKLSNSPLQQQLSGAFVLNMPAQSGPSGLLIPPPPAPSTSRDSPLKTSPFAVAQSIAASAATPMRPAIPKPPGSGPLPRLPSTGNLQRVPSMGMLSAGANAQPPASSSGQLPTGFGQPAAASGHLPSAFMQLPPTASGQLPGAFGLPPTASGQLPPTPSLNNPFASAASGQMPTAFGQAYQASGQLPSTFMQLPPTASGQLSYGMNLTSTASSQLPSSYALASTQSGQLPAAYGLQPAGSGHLPATFGVAPAASGQLPPSGVPLQRTASFSSAASLQTATSGPLHSDGLHQI